MAKTHERLDFMAACQLQICAAFLVEHSHRLQNQYQNGRLDSVSGIMRIWPSQVPYLDKRLAPRKSSC
jgi:hypothetical protein